MKKEYKDLELEVVNFTAEDVITASGAPCDCDCPTVKVIVPICPTKVMPCPHGMCECDGPMCECVRY